MAAVTAQLGEVVYHRHRHALIDRGRPFDVGPISAGSAGSQPPAGETEPQRDRGRWSRFIETPEELVGLHGAGVPEPEEVLDAA